MLSAYDVPHMNRAEDCTNLRHPLEGWCLLLPSILFEVSLYELKPAQIYINIVAQGIVSRGCFQMIFMLLKWVREDHRFRWISKHPDILHKIFQNCDHCPPLQRTEETHDLLSEVSVPYLTKPSKMKKIKLKWRK